MTAAPPRTPAPKACKARTRVRQRIGKICSHPLFFLLPAFLLPFLLMGGVYILLRTYPFGDKSVLSLDLSAQYVYYYEKLREVLTSGDSWLYAWERALGGEFLGIFFYYLCSPFSLIVLIFSKSHIQFAILAIILCKCGTCGAGMYYYLMKSRPGSRWQILTFSTMYAMCGYGVIQKTNTMWIDAMYLTPLVLLGLERLIRERKFLLFTVSLAAVFISNYYIGFMVALFVAVYFLYYYFSEIEFRLSKRFWKTVGLFVLFAVIAALIACVSLVPTIYSLSFGKMSNAAEKLSLSATQNFDFLDFFTKLLPCSYDTIRMEGLPSVYSGVLALLLLPLYFFSTDIPGKKKLLSALFLSGFVLCMNFSLTNLLFHGLTMPNWMNYRYSFLFSLLALLLSYEAMRRLPQMRGAQIALSAAALIFLTVVIQRLHYSYLSDFYTIWLTIGCALVYTVLLLPAVQKRRVAALGVILCIMLELGASAYYTTVHKRADIGNFRYGDYTGVMTRYEQAKEIIRADDPDGLYRTEKNFMRDINDHMAVRLFGVSHSTSTLNQDVIRLLNRLGYSSQDNHSCYEGNTPLSDALLGIRYVICDTDLTSNLGADISLRDRLYSNLGTTASGDVVYRNDLDPGIAFSVCDQLRAIDLEQYPNAFERMNAIVTAMLGEEETVRVFQPVKTVQTSTENADLRYVDGHLCYEPQDPTQPPQLTFTVTAPVDGMIYAQPTSDYNNRSELEINGQPCGTALGLSWSFVRVLGDMKKGEQATYHLTAVNNGKIVLRDTPYIFYYLDEAVLQNVMQRLQNGAAQITSWRSTALCLTVEKRADAPLLYTSIPYDTGWHITVDGKKVDAEKAMDALIAVDLSTLSDGTHEVSFVYFPRIYCLGVILPVLGIALLIAACAVTKKKEQKQLTKQKKEEKQHEAISQLP